jgi:hypothetical protein
LLVSPPEAGALVASEAAGACGAVVGVAQALRSMTRITIRLVIEKNRLLYIFLLLFYLKGTAIFSFKRSRPDHSTRSGTLKNGSS